jgi:hypothetical protein
MPSCARLRQSFHVSSDTVMITLFTICTAFLVAVILKIRKLDHKRVYRYVKFTHLIFLALTIVAIVLLLNSWSFRGFLTDKLFVVIYVSTGMILFGLTRKGRRRGTRTYYGFFFCLPFLLFLGVIPAFRFITVVIGGSLLLDGEHTRYPIDKTYSIQTSRVGVLSAGPTYSLIEHKFFVFEKVTDDIVPKVGVPETLVAERVSQDSFKLTLISSELYEKLDTILSLER